MKKIICVLLILSGISFDMFAVPVPQKLAGLWEGKDRIVFFENDLETQENQLIVVLKEFYGWYYDRAAESKKYSEENKRIRNSATPKNAEKITILNIEETSNKSDSCTGVIKLRFSSHQENEIPYFIKFYNGDSPESKNQTSNGDSLYIDFYTQDEKNPLFYKGVPYLKGLLISEQTTAENLSGLIFDNDKIYDIRYWKTDMDFSDELVNFKYENDEYMVPKHIYISQTNYSCVSGRSKKIRNTVKSKSFIPEEYIFTEDKTVAVKKQEPYLKKIIDSETYEELMEIVKKANSRRKPEPEPLFPVKTKL